MPAQRGKEMENTGMRDVAQWESTSLTCVRPWVCQCHQEKKEGRKERKRKKNKWRTWKSNQTCIRK
jgi:hypothetical protein